MDTQYKGLEPTDEVMEKINRFAVSPLTAEQVFCFRVVLCDNRIDRDLERFSRKALDALAKLYIGKTGIFDHDPRGTKQNARIYDTEVREYPDRTAAGGESCAQLIGYAYMVRTDDNRSLIAEISGGIKKEVSVGCAVAKKLCSVCGSDVSRKSCGHVKGRTYGGRLCYLTLEEPVDAYEWSFVAVPAQPGAGVTKTYSEGGRPEGPEDKCQGPDEGIVLSACRGLVKDILKISYFARPYSSAEEVRAMTDRLDYHGLEKLKEELERELRKKPAGREDFGPDREDSTNRAFKV